MLKKLITACLIVAMLPGLASARTRLKNICRIKGQEENVLRGWGLVIGLNGTGEANDGPTMRAIARAMEIMGNPIALPDAKQAGLDELKKMKKVAYSETNDSKASEEMVHAIDAANIKVRIPEIFMRDPVAFASDLLEIQMEEPQTESRVVINPRAGTIVISGDVEIGDVIVSHKNVGVDATTSPTFSAIDVDQSSAPKCQTLADQLNSLKVPTADMVEIIKGIERNGKLHGRLIIE